MKIIKQAEDLLRKILIHQRGRLCEICQSSTNQLGLFHILNKKDYPRLRLDPDNILIAGWFCCHNKYHHDPMFARDKAWPRFKVLRGENWELRLKFRHATLPRMTATQAAIYKAVFEKELDEL